MHATKLYTTRKKSLVKQKKNVSTSGYGQKRGSTWGHENKSELF